MPICLWEHFPSQASPRAAIPLPECNQRMLASGAYRIVRSGSLALPPLTRGRLFQRFFAFAIPGILARGNWSLSGAILSP